MIGGTQDKKKCFDYIMSELGIRIWEHLGLEDPYLDAMRAFEWESDTYVKLQGSCHRVGRRANSIFQGDAGAMAKANTIFAAFLRRLELRTPVVKAVTYVDDGVMRANQRNNKSLKTAWQESIKFNEMTGQKPNFKKSHIWGTTTQARRAVRNAVMDEEVSCLMTHKSVGYALTTGKRVSRVTSDARVNKALKTLQRIKAIPIKPVKKIISGAVDFFVALGPRSRLNRLSPRFFQRAPKTPSASHTTPPQYRHGHYHHHHKHHQHHLHNK